MSELSPQLENLLEAYDALKKKYKVLLDFTILMSNERESRLEGCFYFKLAKDALKQINELQE